MVRRDLHPFRQVETVRVEALHPGMQGKLLAFLAARFRDQPIENLSAEAERAVDGPRR